MRTWLLLLAAVPLAAQDAAQTPAPASTTAQDTNAVPPLTQTETTWTGSVDLGYRWFSGAGGSLDTYRSVVDFGSGVRLLGLDLSIESATKKYFDRINLRGAGWGGDPYNTAHVDAVRHDWYNFSFDYRNVAYFNFLPSFADPTIGSGIFVDQQSFDSIGG